MRERAVVAKRDFSIPRYDDKGELIGIATIPIGCKGKAEYVEQQEANVYSICFTKGDRQVTVSLEEVDIGFYIDFV